MHQVIPSIIRKVPTTIPVYIIQVIIKFAHHGDAGAAGRHNRFFVGEHFNEAFCDWDDLFAVAGVESRLAAAGLLVDVFNLCADVTQHPDHGQGRLRIQMLGKTRYK